MTAINFPDSPSNGDTHVVGGVTYTYDSTETKWKTTINSNAFLPLTGGTVSGNIVLGGEIQHDGDTDTKLHFDTDTIKFDTAGSERFRIDSSGRLLVGTNSARGSAYISTARLGALFERAGGYNGIAIAANESGAGGSYISLLKSRGVTNGSVDLVSSDDNLGGISFEGTDGTKPVQAASIFAFVDGTPGADDMPGRIVFSTTADGASSPTERMRITSTGDLRFNSGYGSVATAYGCRAWISFDASSGTPTIQASGNISSITDLGTGQFTFNFTSSFPDANYAVVGMTQDGTSGLNSACECARIGDRTTTSNSMSFTNYNESSFADNKRNCVLWMR